MSKQLLKYGRSFYVSLLSVLVAWGVVTASVAISSSTVTALTVSELSAEIEALEEESARYQGEADRIRNEANSLENTMNAITIEKSAIQAQLDVSQTRRTQIELRISEINTRMESQRKTLSKLIARMYIDGRVTPVEILAGSNTVADFVSKQDIRNSVRSKVQGAIKEIKSLKSELVVQQQEIEQNIKDQEAQRTALAAKESEQTQLLALTRGEEARFQELSRDADEKRRKAFAALESLNTSTVNAASNGFVKAGTVIGYVGNTGLTTGPHLHLEARLNGSVTDPAGYGWPSPTSGPITQGFGNPSPWYARGYHPGVDYAPAIGTPIRAVADGTLYRGCTDVVLGAGYNNAYGYMAIINHGNGVQSLYGHMQAGPDGAACNYGYFQY